MLTNFRYGELTLMRGVSSYVLMKGTYEIATSFYLEVLLKIMFDEVCGVKNDL